MMIGIINAFHEATLRLVVQSANGQQREIEVVLDTGYSASLTLPPQVIADLGLAFHSRGSAILADGNETEFNTHRATIIWDGSPRSILVDAADTTPLLGMELLYGHNINIDAVDGGTVKIDRL